jgi:hypothetical protein
MLGKDFGARALSCLVRTGVIAAFAWFGTVGVAEAQYDPVIFSFATVGDSRTDPLKPDATTLLANPSPTTQGGVPSLTGSILPQDNEWVQNTMAFGQILQGIQQQAPNLLFFNGDMIFGYGRPTLPTAWASGKPNSWTTSQTLSPDTIFEYVQYAYWRGMVANLFLNGTYVIPVPGNHETQCSYSAAPYTSTSPNPNCTAPTTTIPSSYVASQGLYTGKTAYADNENAFRYNMGDLITDLTANLRFSNVSGFFATNVNGTTAGGTPAPTASTNNGPISSDQTDLTYSFDIVPQTGLLLHFVVINTDPAGSDATAPADWLASDLAAAKLRATNASSAIKYFVFGHKPAFTYNYAAANGGTTAPPATNTPGPAGLDSNYIVTVTNGAPSYGPPTYRNAFWSVIAQYGATYFSGHEHTVNVAQYADPTGASSNTPYQVVVGSGGSPFDDKLAGTCSSTPGKAPGCVEPKLTNIYDRYYAWATVSVHASGKVSLQVNGFGDGYAYPTPYNASNPLPPGQFGPVQDLTIYDVANLQ